MGSFDYRFYDSLSRLLQADYNFGDTVYNYGYDVAGNMTNYDGVIRTYNAANQMVNDGTNTLVYDNNGNLRTVGSDTYTWDRANRLLSVGNHSYVYDGLSNRIQQTVSSVVTDYLNDLQPGLTKLLKQTTGANVEQFVHAPRGIHAVDDGTDWNFYAQDGLGSVRAVVDDSAVVQSSMSFDPYGNPMASYGAGFGFTGEQTDENGSVFLRARYYEPNLGVFNSRDSFGGFAIRSQTLNRYAYVNGNPVVMADPSGHCAEAFATCGASLAFVVDNAAMVGFVVDAAACLWAAGCGLTAALAAIVAANVAEEVAEEDLRIWEPIIDAIDFDNPLSQQHPNENPETNPTPQPLPIPLPLDQAPRINDPCSDDDDDELARVRHYSRRIEEIQRQMKINVNMSMGPYIWVEYPITTTNTAESIQATTSSFLRPLNGRGGFVEFNIDNNLLRQDPNLPEIRNSSIIDFMRSGSPAETVKAILQSGLSLNDPDKNAIFYNWMGQSL